MQVPLNPLTGFGLATPYILVLPCNQTAVSSFVEGVIYDTNANTLNVYNPLVITQGTTPLVTPVPITIAASAVVGLWFGSNAGSLTLTDNNNGVNLASGNCVNGLTGSIFGQVAWCNALEFFLAANNGLLNGKIIVPPLGMANDGLPCPTVRDFFVVDMDQSDNVVTTYIAVGSQTAQDTTANRNAYGTAVTLSNGSDNRLLAIAMDSALGCSPWHVTTTMDPANTLGLASMAMNELHAANRQGAPMALVPLGHAMARLNNQPSLAKVNAYRQGTNQPFANTVGDADTVVYCTNLYYTLPARLNMNQNSFTNAGSPENDMATNLFAFLAQRFATTFTINGLNCAALLGVQNPVLPLMNNAGIATGAVITVPIPPGSGGLSKGAVAGIVIVVLLVVIAVPVAIIVKLRWTRIKTYVSEKNWRVTLANRSYA